VSCTPLNTQQIADNDSAETFFRVTAFGHMSKIVAPSLAGALMRIDAWLVVYGGLGFLTTTLITTTTLPETLHWKRGHGQVSATDHEAPRDASDTETGSKPARRFNRHKLHKIWDDWRLMFITLTYPFRMTMEALGELLQRYTSNRYGWTLANATFVYTVQAVGAGVTLFVLLPALCAVIDRRFSFTVIHKNVILSRCSLLIMTIAFVTIGLAPTPVIMLIGVVIETLSKGFPATMRAIATALTDDDDRGSIFSLYATVEALSVIVAYPLTAVMFNVGLEKGGGMWLGLPYMVVSAVAALCCLAMCLVRFEQPVKI
jgi:hypothetical protein